MQDFIWGVIIWAWGTAALMALIGVASGIAGLIQTRALRGAAVVGMTVNLMLLLLVVFIMLAVAVQA